MSAGPNTFKLTIITSDDAAEIFVLDSQFRRIGQTAGRKAEFVLPKGLYTVKIRTGSAYSEKSLALFSDETVTFDPVHFSSAAPLEQTAKTHEYHIGNAQDHSRATHMHLGAGSQLYVFARDYTEQGSFQSRAAESNPARGLTLLDRHGHMLVDLEHTSVVGQDSDPWAACNIDIPPDCYRLNLRTAAGDVLEQTIACSPGWQTQIFLLQKNYGVCSHDFRADLPNASIFMSRIGHGFNTSQHHPESDDFRLVELARQAITSGRSVLSDTFIHSALHSKHRNPMLGLFGAHLLLLNKEYDNELLKHVVHTLRELLGESHPDVETLAIKSRIGSTFICDLPPMLRTSWQFLLAESVTNPQLIPEISYASEIAGSLWSEGLWMVWGTSSKKKDTNELLIEHLKNFAENEAGEIPGAKGLQKGMQKPESPVGADIFSLPEPVDENAVPPAAGDPLLMDEEKITMLVNMLGVPRARLEAAIKSINQNSFAN